MTVWRLRLSVLRSATGIAFTFTLFLVPASILSASASPLQPSTEPFSSLLKQGFDLHQQSRYADALPILERAHKLEPSDYFVNLLLGIDLLRTGKPAEAIPRLHAAANARPSEEFPEDYLGEAHAVLGHAALAAEAYELAVERGKNSESSLEAWAGFALERFRQISESLRASQAGLTVAKRLQTAAQTDEFGSMTASGCAAEIPRLERTLATRSSPPAAAPASEPAYRLSLCYAVIAGDVAGRLQHGAEDRAALHRLRGDVFLRLKGDAAAAKTEYEQAITIRPHDPTLLERLAEASLSAGDLDSAQSSAKSALAIDPGRRDATRTLVNIAMSQRDYAAAIPMLRQLASQSPHDQAVKVQLGSALAQTGAYQQALPLIQSTLAAGYPDEKGALHALLARTLRKLNREAEAATAETEARRLADAYQARVAPVDDPGTAAQTPEQSAPEKPHAQP